MYQVAGFTQNYSRYDSTFSLKLLMSFNMMTVIFEQIQSLSIY